MRLYLSNYFAYFVPDYKPWVEIDISTPVSLREVISGLGIPLGEVHLIVVNEQLQESADVLVDDNDVVRLYPAVNGG